MSGQSTTTLLDRNHAPMVRAADHLEVIHPDITTTCPDCQGTGISEDDGSITGLDGWPIPCCCIVNDPHGLTAIPACTTLHLPATTVPVRRRAVTW
jgi:hypothetical protein